MDQFILCPHRTLINLKKLMIVYLYIELFWLPPGINEMWIPYVSQLILLDKEHACVGARVCVCEGGYGVLGGESAHKMWTTLDD